MAMFDRLICVSILDVNRRKQIMGSDQMRVKLQSSRGSRHFLPIFGTSFRLALFLQSFCKQIMRKCFAGVSLDGVTKLNQRFTRIMLLRLDKSFGDSQKSELRINPACGLEIICSVRELTKLSKQDASN